MKTLDNFISIPEGPIDTRKPIRSTKPTSMISIPEGPIDTDDTVSQYTINSEFQYPKVRLIPY